MTCINFENLLVYYIEDYKHLSRYSKYTLSLQIVIEYNFTTHKQEQLYTY